MTPVCLRFLTAAALSAALVGCGPPQKPPPAPVEPTTAPITVPAFTPEAMPTESGEKVLPAPTAAETTPKTAMKLPPATEPAPATDPNVVIDVVKPIVDPRLLVNGMAVGMVMRPRQTYDAPAFNTPEMQELLKRPAKSFDATGIHDARKVELMAVVATLEPAGAAPSFVAVVKLTDKEAGDELVAGPLSQMEAVAIGDKTIYVAPPPPFQGGNVQMETRTETISADQSEELFVPPGTAAPEKADAPAPPAPPAPPKVDGCQEEPKATEANADPNVQPGDVPVSELDPPALPEAVPQATWRVDDVTFAVAPRPQLEALIKSYDAGEKASDELISLLSSTEPTADVAVVFLTAPVKGQLDTLAAQLPPLPGPFKDVAKLPELISSATLTLSISPEPKLSIATRSPDEASSKRVAALLENGLQEVKPMWGLGKQGVMAQVPEERFQPAVKWLVSLVDKAMKGLKVSQAGDEATLALSGLGTLEAIVAEGAPHVRMMTVEMRKAADRTIAMNNLKQLALAFHVHADMFRNLPPAAVCDPNGKPLLSWRVAILPLIEQGDLAKQFHLDEPWDSEHNKSLIDKMPDVYRSPGVVVEAGKTLFLLPTGPHAAFDGGKKPTFAEITDGLSNTLLIVEVNPDQAVTWTKPDDLPIDLNALPNLGKARDGGVLAVMMDGAVNVLANKINPDLLKAFLTPRGGEPTFGTDIEPTNDFPGTPAAPTNEASSAPAEKTAAESAPVPAPPQP